MKRVIFKYAFSDLAKIHVPWWPSSKVRLIAEQFGGSLTPTLWVEHPVERMEPAPHERAFVLVGTGEPFDETNWYFEGSAVCNDGQLVWHVYATTASLS